MNCLLGHTPATDENGEPKALVLQLMEVPKKHEWNAICSMTRAELVDAACLLGAARESPMLDSDLRKFIFVKQKNAELKPDGIMLVHICCQCFAVYLPRPEIVREKS